MKLSKLFGLILVLAVVVPVLSAFAQDEVEEVTLPYVDPALVEGDMVIAGSSTVYPVTVAIVERFRDAGYAGEITVDSIGTGAGFERFCVAGETDISNASRAIKDSEIEACATIERTPLEFRVGTDALAIVVNPDNDFIGEEGLTVEQLGGIFGGEFTTWDQVNPEYPAEPIALFSAGTDSGTFDYFVEAVMRPYAESQGVAEDAIADEAEKFILNAAGIQLSEDDNVLVQGVSENTYAIGYFGYAYYVENTDVLRILNINGVEATFESVEGVGDTEPYPLARPLFIYSDATVMSEKPQVAEFINYYLSNVNDIYASGEVGYFPASVEALNEGKLHWYGAWCAWEGNGETEECVAAMEMMAE